MKFTLFFVSIIVIGFTNAYAQQPPAQAAASRLSLEQKMQAPEIKLKDDLSKLAPARTLVRSPSPPQLPQTTNSELSELLRAQTTAIQSLSSKLDSLEDRIRKVEKVPR